MKKLNLILAAALVFLCMGVSVAKTSRERVYTPATELTFANKLLETRSPYERIDVEKYPGLTKIEIRQAKCCTGLVIAFRTNSSTIGVRPTFTLASESAGNSSAINVRGFDLYIKDGAKWLWAGSKAPAKKNNEPHDYILLANAVSGMKECLLYLPSYSQLSALDIITDEGSEISALEPPFRHRIAVFGSSFTNCSGCSRPGLGYVAQLSRKTGLNFINMGFSGNSKLQDYFASALIEAQDVDAYVFDAFSNPSNKIIEERLYPFIERFQKEKPGIPLIFMKTAYREKRNFDTAAEEKERSRMELVDRMMKEAVKKYKDVYWVTATNTIDPDHESTTDGTHPNDYGYTLWAESVRKPITKILKKYGIK